ncbi:MAG TPA: 4-(cytidine 5'-diphospho)-2-C-methyl-D-erythritol kinase [Caldimonas sp.]|nr:4-(cytidine 5'-diphospho)-2-C-methyl-D-erythritol kinase [Caldimonas sp.]HEX4235871.1 4-(cytidine 5'-diphospho)-2-C-methyl-D-erythritol kinase [Caldimonas sp.]
MVAIHDVPAPAKLNLFLHVVGKRADGMHLIDSLMVLIDWCDTLHFEPRSDGTLHRHDLTVALPADDLCLRAARALQSASATAAGADITVEKRVPSGAGLGGGSSDAASTLLALNRLWRLDWPLERLLRIGAALGADVPFFLGATNAFASGIGERLAPAQVDPAWFAVVKPEAGLATADVFASAAAAERAAARIAGFSEAVPGVDAGPGGPLNAGPRLAEGFGRNDLQAAAEGLCPDVRRAAAALHRIYGNSRMTGSGSAVFAHAGSGPTPSAAMPGDWPSGWSGRMCRSLARHPLASWASRDETGVGLKAAGPSPPPA